MGMTNMEERRQYNGEILVTLAKIDGKLDNLNETTVRHGAKLDKINDTIHGNGGNDGLKTSVGRIKTQAKAAWAVITVLIAAIINDYVRRG